MHVDLVARKKQIEREKGRENVKFPFKKEGGEGNKEERRQRKINLLELNFSPKFLLWIKNRKGKEENQSVGVALTKYKPKLINYMLTVNANILKCILLITYGYKNN